MMVATGKQKLAVVRELQPEDHALIESLGGTEHILKQFEEKVGANNHSPPRALADGVFSSQP